MLLLFKVTQSCPTLCNSWTTTCQAPQYFTISRSLFKLMPIVLVKPSNHFILCHPLLLLPSIFPKSRVFSNESALHIRWPKYWSFSISPSSLRLISFRSDWFDLLAILWLFATPLAAACQASLSTTNSRSLLKLMSIESVMPSCGAAELIYVLWLVDI